MRQVLSGQHRSQNSLLEKTGRIRPNPLSTYPHSDNKAPESVYQAAVGALSQKMKTVEKSIQFVDSPYEYLLEVAALSNVSACYLWPYSGATAVFDPEFRPPHLLHL